MPNSIDGIKKVQKTPKIPETKIKNRRPAAQGRQLDLLEFIRPAKIAAFALIFCMVFGAAITTSKILTEQQISSPSRILGAFTTAVSTTAAASQSPLSQPQIVFLPKEHIRVPNPLQDRREFLKDYLAAKHSPLASHVDAISLQSQWKLIIAIAQAESSSCKKYPEYSANCWGVGGANNLMQFSDLDSAIAHVNGLLENKYIAKGLTSPHALAKKWVGHPNDNWEQAVQQELNNLQSIQ